MQIVTTGLELLSKRLALSGLCSRRQADVLIKDGRVRVDGQIVKTNEAVPDVSSVSVNLDKSSESVPVPPPPAVPRLWAIGKPRGVACAFGTGKIRGLRELVDEWDAKNRSIYGDRWSDLVSDLPRHFIPVNAVEVNDRGLVLLTTDGDFARNLATPESGLLTGYRLKVSGGFLQDEHCEEVFRKWKQRDNISVRVIKRSNEGCVWLRVEMVATGRDESLSALLWQRLNLRVLKAHVESFGPYALNEVPIGQVLPLQVHRSIKHLIPKRTMYTALMDEHTNRILSYKPAA